MGRKKRKFEIKDAEVPISAMIDVVFLLLVYFIVSQKPIIEDALLPIDLPAPGAPAKQNQAVQLFKIDVAKLSRDSDNIYHVNNQPYYFNDLKALLKQRAETNPDTSIIINCDPNAKHKKLIRLLDVCSEYGLTKLNLVNDATVRFVKDN